MRFAKPASSTGLPSNIKHLSCGMGRKCVSPTQVTRVSLNSNSSSRGDAIRSTMPASVTELASSCQRSEFWQCSQMDQAGVGHWRRAEGQPGKLIATLQVRQIVVGDGCRRSDPVRSVAADSGDALALPVILVKATHRLASCGSPTRLSSPRSVTLELLRSRSSS